MNEWPYAFELCVLLVAAVGSYLTNIAFVVSICPSCVRPETKLFLLRLPQSPSHAHDPQDDVDDDDDKRSKANIIN